MVPSIGLSSRGDDEERVMAIENAIHVEEHLTDVMAQNPEQAGDLGLELDAARRMRQALVADWSGGGGAEEHWCIVKHAMSREYHLREMLANASRISPDRVQSVSRMLADAIRDRKAASSRFLGKASQGKGCVRCAADLHVSDEPAQSLNTRQGHIKPSIHREVNPMKAMLKEVGMLEVGQLVGQGGIYAADKIEEKWPGQSGILRTRNLVNVVGGLGLAILPSMLMKGKGKAVQNALMVAGTAMLAKGIVDIVKDQVGASGVGARSITRGVSYARTAQFSRQGVPMANNGTYGPMSPNVALF